MGEREPSAAQALYGHLPSAERPLVKQREQSLASSMYPVISQEAKAREAQQAKAREELKAHNRRMAEHLQATIDAIRAEKRGR